MSQVLPVGTVNYARETLCVAVTPTRVYLRGTPRRWTIKLAIKVLRGRRLLRTYTVTQELMQGAEFEVDLCCRKAVLEAMREAAFSPL